MISATVVTACTSAAEDNAMLALGDVASAAGDAEYRIIGGSMVRILRHLYNVPGQPRLTADADAGIDANVVATTGFHERLSAIGYDAESGNRYVLGERVVDLLVPTEGRPGMRMIGGRAIDGAPGLRLALALDPIWVTVTARLTSGDAVEFNVPVPDVEAAFVLKMLARTVRAEERDLRDIETLLDIVATEPTYLASGWQMNDARLTRGGERKDAARESARMIAGPPTMVPARVRALLKRHVAVPSTGR